MADGLRAPYLSLDVVLEMEGHGPCGHDNQAGCGGAGPCACDGTLRSFHHRVRLRRQLCSRRPDSRNRIRSTCLHDHCTCPVLYLFLLFNYHFNATKFFSQTTLVPSSCGCRVQLTLHNVFRAPVSTSLPFFVTMPLPRTLPFRSALLVWCIYDGSRVSFLAQCSVRA